MERELGLLQLSREVAVSIFFSKIISCFPSFVSVLWRTKFECLMKAFFVCVFVFTNPHFYLFSRSLNPRRVQHHTDSACSGLSRKVTSEFGTNHATVSMSSRYLSPDYSGFGRFSTRSYCVVLCFVHISTSLA